MDILFVANWSAPGIVGANYASSGVHFELSRRGLEVGVLSSLVGHSVSKELSTSFEISGRPLTEMETSNIRYLLPSLPKGWSARHIHNSDWEDAVAWGVELLRKYQPKVVHIQQWQNFWWMGEAAARCDIPLNYTPYDFGLVCARTVLINSDGSKCEGTVGFEECRKCIYNGRGLVGKINENLVAVPLFSRLLKVIAQRIPQLKLHDRGIVVDPIQTRLENDRTRLTNLLSNLDTLVVNSDFSRRLFGHYKEIENSRKIHWFQNLKSSSIVAERDPEFFSIGFIGRISPEKGPEILLEAIRISAANGVNNIKLVVAGDASSSYAQQLKQTYQDLNIEWLGWIDSSELASVYDQIDMLVVPSLSYDNGPITIMEAIATKTPIIVSNNETLLTYLENIESDHKFESGSPEALSQLISEYVNNPNLIDAYVSEIPEPMTVEMYVDQLMPTYVSQLNAKAG
jgi:glycosyltransferase involved in cell wall biosynthesis